MRPLLATLLALTLPAHGALSPDAARSVVEANRQALVIVEGVLKVSMTVNGARRGEPRETRVSGSGFVVDPSGLVLVSRLLLNPAGSLYRKPIRMEAGGQSVEMIIKADLENLRVRLHNRSEFPARLLLEDVDQGLLLLTPDLPQDAPATTYPAVRLDTIATAIPYAQYLIVDQGEASFRNDVVLVSGTINGIVNKPYPLYLQDLGRSWHFVSAPFFDTSGKLLGMGLLNAPPPPDLTAGTWETRPVPAIVPATTIRDLVGRALKKDLDSPPPTPASPERLPQLPATQAAALADNAAPSVVVIEGSLRYKCGRCTEEHEETLETVGTVVGPDGLVIVANDGESSDNQYLEQHLRCVLADRSEIPYQILLHDDELLLTVLGPAQRPADSSPLPKPLPLPTTTKAQLGDPVVVFGRLGKESRYALSVAVAQITARTEVPRLFYQVINTPPAASYAGLPILAPDGTLLGISAPDPVSDRPEDQDPDNEDSPRVSGRTRIIPASVLPDLLNNARKAHAKPPA